MPSSIPSEAVFNALPLLWKEDLRHMLSEASARRTLCVLDDDPTGTQTVHDVPVLTHWSVEALARELRRAPSCFYLLTNSRSMPSPEAGALTREIAENLRSAVLQTGRAIIPVSRSDSTLRGHYPLETDVLDDILGPFDATFLCFYFEAGGRYTIGNTHYVAEENRLVPAAETPFARDRAFGYTRSDLRQWVEEKTSGRISAAEVCSLPLELIRQGGPRAVCDAILALPRGAHCIVNSARPGDMEVFAAGVFYAEEKGRRYLFRSAAQLVAARLGQDAAELAALPVSRSGGLVIVGSYVPKTTRQLENLLADGTIMRLELDVSTLLGLSRDSVLADACSKIDGWLAEKRTIVVYTSRTLAESNDPRHSLEQGARISGALVTLVAGLKERPGFLVAKGGITSSDIATKALGIRRAMVLGQIAPGIPVWQTGEETLFPGLPYVIFPGNVGGVDTLRDVVKMVGG